MLCSHMLRSSLRGSAPLTSCAKRAFAGQSSLPATIGELVDQQSAQLEFRDAFRNMRSGVRWTYGEFKEHVDAVAVGFVQYGFSGQNVVSSLPNNIENFVDLYAAARSRTVITPISPNGDELKAALSAVNARGWILPHKFNAVNMLKFGHTVIPELADCDSGDVLKSYEFRNLLPPIQTGAHVNDRGYLKYRDLPVYDPLPSPLPELAQEIRPTDAILTTFEGGKLHTFSHQDVLKNAAAVAEALGLVRDERLYIASNPESSLTQVAGVGAFLGGAFQISSVVPNLKDSTVNDLLKDIALEQSSVVLLSADLAAAIAQHPHVTKHKFHVDRVAIVASTGDAVGEVAASVAQALGASKTVVVETKQGVCGAATLNGRKA